MFLLGGYSLNAVRSEPQAVDCLSNRKDINHSIFEIHSRSSHSEGSRVD